MTENRCIELLKKMKHMFTETCAKIDENTALDMGVEAIKEIQQYRAITDITADDLKALEKDEIQTIGDVLNVFSEWYKYKAIGTTEEFKALKEKSVAKKPNQVSKAMDKYKYVGLIGRCPNCGSIVAEDNLVCEDCFQVLDWSE